MLERKPAKTEVINMGVTAYGLARDYDYLQPLGFRFKPDIVILAFCQNDIEDGKDSYLNIGNPAGAASQRHIDASELSFLRHVKLALHEHSRLFAAVVEVINTNQWMVRTLVAFGVQREVARTR